MELNYKTFGSGPALVILHGLFGSLDNWQSLARQFAEHFSVFIVDLPNHGKSPHSEAPFNYETMAASLEGFLDSQGLHRAHLLGHSMGGKVVMHLALHQGERVDKLVVADMAPVTYGPHHSDVFAAMDKLNPAAIANRQAAEAVLATELKDEAVRQFLLKSLALASAGGYEWKFNLSVIRRDYAHILAAVDGEPFSGPTLFIKGGKSPYVKDEYKPRILELFPQAQFAQVAAAGHWLHAEQPQAFFAEVNRFLLTGF